MMGTLKKFDIDEFIKNTNIDVFVETGTYRGDSLEYALNYNFKRLYSIELLEKYYKLCLDKFSKNQNVKIINKNSIDGLVEILPNIKDDSVLFWLDAHLPDFYDTSFGSDYLKDIDIFIPLKSELEVIKNMKDISNDVFIIDDLRIYETGEYESGNWLGVISSGYNSGIGFIYEILSKTHKIEKMFKDEGYIICVPLKK